MAEQQVDVHGRTAAGWEGVRDAFALNFAEGREVGAAFSAYHRGEKVVDLWAGTADEDAGTPWEEETMVMVFSSTKGPTAVCANQLAQEGRLDVDAPVAEYWPEFAAAGKQDIPVSYLLSHRAGLAWMDESMPLDEAMAWDPVIRALERQAPGWEPGTGHGYHAATYGWLVGEVVRRIGGQSLGAYLADHVAAPLDLDFYVGLPESLEPRVARLISFLPKRDENTTDEGAQQMQAAINAFMGPDTPLGKTFRSPVALTGDGLDDEDDLFNSRAVHAGEAPAFNGIGDARSLARLYASTVGEVDGVRLLGPAQQKAATIQQTEGGDLVLFGLDLQFGLGFMLHSSLIALGGPSSFGHFGMGGSVGWADPDAELGMAYVMNKMDLGVTGDVRAFRLIHACYDAIG